MPNPSPWGAFAEGIAGGVERGFSAYTQGVMAGIQKRQQQDIQRAEMNYKVFTDENIPLSIRKKAYEQWGTINKDWNTGIKAPEISDEDWEQKKLTPYFKKGQAILKSKDYSLQEKLGFLRELEAEAIDKAGLKVGEAAKFFGGMGAEAQRQQVAGLLQPGVDQSQLMSGLSQAYGEEQAAGIRSAIESGVPLEEATKMFPKKVQATPKTVRLGGNLYQIKDDEAKLIKAGSIDEKAYYNATKDPEWQDLDEEGQFELIEKHKRFLTGNKQPKKEAKALTFDEASKLGAEIKKQNPQASPQELRRIARELARQRGYSF